jgi:ATP-dependent DNA helicase RecG
VVIFILLFLNVITNIAKSKERNPVPLAVDIHRLLNGGVVEWERIEFKKTFYSSSVLHSICAFANDINNTGGGYIIIGVELNDRRRPILPPYGLSPGEIKIFKEETLQICHRLRPHYSPIIDVVDYKNKKILVLWVPTGPSRPYQALRGLAKSRDYFFYIRKNFSTKKATVQEELDLMAAANQLPFDSQLHHLAEVTDLNVILIQEYLAAVKSNLLAQSVENDMPFLDLCKRMNIVGNYGDDIKPKNVSLLLFNNNPQQFFPSSRIEVAEFDELGRLRERIFTGPLFYQIDEVLRHIQSRVIVKMTERLLKGQGKLEWFNYPFNAIKEAVINAVYHRCYKENAPIEIRILPQGMEIISYPGPLLALDHQELKSGQVSIRKYRNPLLGYFFKQRRLVKSKATGLANIGKAMKDNGSLEPVFKIDKKRKYFKVFLPIHPKFAPKTPNLENPDKALKEINKIVLSLSQVCPKYIDVKMVILVLIAVRQEISLEDLMFKLNQTNKSRFRKDFIKPLMGMGWLEYTIANKTTSSKQKYTITKQGSNIIEEDFVEKDCETPTLCYNSNNPTLEIDVIENK